MRLEREAKVRQTDLADKLGKPLVGNGFAHQPSGIVGQPTVQGRAFPLVPVPLPFHLYLYTTSHVAANKNAVLT